MEFPRIDCVKSNAGRSPVYIYFIRKEKCHLKLNIRYSSLFDISIQLRSHLDLIDSNISIFESSGNCCMAMTIFEKDVFARRKEKVQYTWLSCDILQVFLFLCLMTRLSDIITIQEQNQACLENGRMTKREDCTFLISGTISNSVVEANDRTPRTSRFFSSSEWNALIALKFLSKWLAETLANS